MAAVLEPMLVGTFNIALDRFYSHCFVAIKGLALLHFLSGKGCQAAYMIDNTVDFFYV
jgi:hypothetical protein